MQSKALTSNCTISVIFPKPTQFLLFESDYRSIIPRSWTTSSLLICLICKQFSTLTENLFQWADSSVRGLSQRLATRFHRITAPGPPVFCVSVCCIPSYMTYVRESFNLIIKDTNALGHCLVATSHRQFHHTH